MKTVIDHLGVTSQPGDTGLEVKGGLVVNGTSVLEELAELKRTVQQQQSLIEALQSSRLLGMTPNLTPTMAAQFPEEHAAHVRERLKVEAAAEPSVPVVAINFPEKDFPWESDPSPKGSSEPPLETPPAPPPVVTKPPIASGKTTNSAKTAKASK